MAILEPVKAEITGISKGIDASANDLVLDILQRFQYQFPIKSTIRELASNGVDSVNEKKVALSILSGETSVEDHYEEREGDLYKDSKFDPTYYDPRWLSMENKVTITYHVGEGSEKDKVTIEDTGVGLGRERLMKYFSLGYSTKRLSKAPLGKFGIGAKAPLSIGPYYTIESRYNGLKYRFNVYNAKVEPIVPRFDLQTGKENVLVIDGEVPVYAYETEELNGVTVTIEAKKHHLSEYKDAVTKQLMYFEDVEFYVREHNNSVQENFKPNILFEDDYVLVSDNKMYTRPHILLNKVNYGYIDFQELELGFMSGNVGIKVKPEDVEVSPSRESLVWNEVTKTTVLKRFKDAVQTASNLVSQQLNQSDFLAWMQACTTVLNGSMHGDALGQLADIVETHKLKPRYAMDHSIYYSFKLLKKYNIVQTSVYQEKTVKANKKITQVVRNETNFFETVIFLRHRPTSSRKDKYLLSLYQRYTTLAAPWFLRKDKDGNPVAEEMPEDMKSEDRAFSEKLWYYICQSKNWIDYDTIEVPKDFVANDDDDAVNVEDTENLSEEEKQDQSLSAAERRKLSGKTVVHTPRINPDGDRRDVARAYEWQKLEVPVKEIDEWDEEEIYYGNEVDVDTLEFVARLTRDVRNVSGIHPRGERSGIPDYAVFKDGEPVDLHKTYGVSGMYASRCEHFFNPSRVRLLKVAKDKIKLYKDFKHITKFFARMDGNTLTMSNSLIRWNTARHLKEGLHRIAFLYNFTLDPDKQKQYLDLCTYVDHNYRGMDIPSTIAKAGQEGYNNLLQHLDKVQKFQSLVASGATPHDIATVAQDFWGSTEVKDACSVDLEVLGKLNELIEWSTPVATLLNGMPILTCLPLCDLYEEYKTQGRVRTDIPLQVEEAIASFCREHNVI